MSTSAISKLFQPIHVRVGRVDLRHREVMAPMARFRADAQHVPEAVRFEILVQ